jgi:hypothetical protein
MALFKLAIGLIRLAGNTQIKRTLEHSAADPAAPGSIPAVLLARSPRLLRPVTESSPEGLFQAAVYPEAIAAAAATYASRKSPF